MAKDINGNLQGTVVTTKGKTVVVPLVVHDGKIVPDTTNEGVKQ